MTAPLAAKLDAQMLPIRTVGVMSEEELPSGSRARTWLSRAQWGVAILAAAALVINGTLDSTGYRYRPSYTVPGSPTVTPLVFPARTPVEMTITVDVGCKVGGTDWVQYSNVPSMFDQLKLVAVSHGDAAVEGWQFKRVSEKISRDRRTTWYRDYDRLYGPAIVDATPEAPLRFIMRAVAVDEPGSSRQWVFRQHCAGADGYFEYESPVEVLVVESSHVGRGN